VLATSVAYDALNGVTTKLDGQELRIELGPIR
jgi:hypothetical protein